MDRHRPFFGYIFQSQIEQFIHGLFGGKQIPVAADFTQGAVQRFDRVCRVTDPTDVFWVIEKWDYILPVTFPAFDYRRVAITVIGFKAIEGLWSL